VSLKNKQCLQALDYRTSSLLDDHIKKEAMSIYNVIKLTNKEIINYNQKKNDNAT